MPVLFHFEDVHFILKERRIIAGWIRKVISEEGKKAGDINFVFGSDNWLLKFNNQYLKHDYFTDVITFPSGSEEKVSGDVLISIDRVRDNANQLNIPVVKELLRVMVHGTLHLCGYDDGNEKEKREMSKKEDKYLAAVPRETFLQQI